MVISGPANALSRREPPAWLVAGDTLLALLILPLVCVEIWVLGSHGLGTGQQVVATVLSPAIALPVAFRSVFPLPAFLVNEAATIAMVAIGYESNFYQWANLLMLFTVAATVTGWKSWLGLVVGLAGVAYYFLTFRSEGPESGIMILALWLVVWLVGRIYGSRLEQARLRVDRDLAAELAATRQERLELEAQRTTMARELHDLVGHTVNVMVVHAGAGRRAVRNDPDGAEQAFATIESTGRSALEELDRVLGLLRSDDRDTPLAPLPDLHSLPSLVEDFDRTGLRTSLAIEGAAGSVPAGLGLSVYRIVQEALTNTMKHSAADTADVSIRIGDSHIYVVVTDPGPARPESAGGDASSGGHGPGLDGDTPGGDGEGRGLVGIAERVQLHGGSAEFGPTDEGRFRVDCALPLALTEVPS